MIRKCDKCGSNLVELITSWVCPNSCNKVDTPLKSPGDWGSEIERDTFYQDLLKEQCKNCVNEGDHDNCCGNACDEIPCPGFEKMPVKKSITEQSMMQPVDITQSGCLSGLKKPQTKMSLKQDLHKRQEDKSASLCSMGVWRCGCGKFPILKSEPDEEGDLFWFSCCDIVSFNTSDLKLAVLRWNNLLKQKEGWERLGEVDHIEINDGNKIVIHTKKNNFHMNEDQIISDMSEKDCPNSIKNIFLYYQQKHNIYRFEIIP